MASPSRKVRFLPILPASIGTTAAEIDTDSRDVSPMTKKNKVTSPSM